MKILQVIPFFSPKFGGTVHSVRLLSQELVKRGHEVTIITSDLDFDQEFAESVKQHPVEIIPFPVVANFGLFIYTPSMKAWLDQHISQYDIVHLHNYRAYQNTIATEFAVKNNIPVVLQARGSVLPFFEKKGLKRLYDLVWGNEILGNASKAIALCESEADQYRAMGVPDNKIAIIPNGLDLSQFSSLPAKGTFRAKYHIPADEKIILFLGRIHKIKGIDLLVDAYSELVIEDPDVTLVIAGPEDSYVSEINNQVRDKRLHKDPLITGPLYGEDKLGAYVDADVYVLPSRYEIFGNTILEAWACNTPVIVTEGCQIADVVKTAGYTVPLNELALKDAISIVFNDEVRRLMNIRAGRSLIESEYNLDSVVTRIECLYADVTES
jgi:glycosyltransferase involved in cell wall biosynthesis